MLAWFAAERTPQEWAEVTTLAFVTGAGFRDFETCQQRLERHVARAFAEPTEEEAAEAARRAADRRLALARNALVTVEERENGALTRTALVFATSSTGRGCCASCGPCARPCTGTACGTG